MKMVVREARREEIAGLKKRSVAHSTYRRDNLIPKSIS